MAKKINILYVTWSLELAGAERVVYDLATGLDPEKYNVMVCTFIKGPLMEEIAKNGIKVVHIERKFRYDIMLAWKLFRLISENKIDIVHSHMFQTSLYALPSILTSRRLIFVITEHGGYIEELRIARRRYLYKYLAKISKAITVVSCALKNDMINFFRIAPHKIIVIYNGVDIVKFRDNGNSAQIRESLGLNSSCPVIGNVSNLHRLKGHKYLLEAMPIILNEIQDAKLIIAGGGALRIGLEKQAAELGISENVVFLGRRKDIPDLLTIMDVFVVPSIRETFCIAAAEAMAMGKAVIASRVGGVPELVVDNETGFLVPPKEPQILARRIIELLKNKGLAVKMGQAGKERVEREFTTDKMIKRTESLYESLIRAHL